MKNKSIIIFSAVIVVVIAGFFALNTFLKDTVVNEEESATVAETPEQTPEELVVPTQAGGDNVFVEKVSLDKDGFVAIYRTQEDGTPGKLIGVTKLLPSGVRENFLMNIDEVVNEGDVLFAELYVDNGDGVFDAQSDNPFVKDGEPIMVKFNIVSEGALEDEVKL